MDAMKSHAITHIAPAFSDERGAIYDVFDGENIRHIGYITSAKGTLRGNHYHKIQTQYTYILHGKAQWFTKDLNNPVAETECRVLKAGDLAVDLPGVAHALLALEDTEFIFFTDAVRTDGGYEEDTVRIDIVSEWKSAHPHDAAAS